jgi:hypothetical protein
VPRPFAIRNIIHKCIINIRKTCIRFHSRSLLYQHSIQKSAYQLRRAHRSAIIETDQPAVINQKLFFAVLEV